MDIEIENLQELDPEKVYFIRLAPDATSVQINAFATAVKDFGLRALIARGDVAVQTFTEMFVQLNDEQRARLIKAIGPIQITPPNDEQSKQPSEA